MANRLRRNALGGFIHAFTQQNRHAESQGKDLSKRSFPHDSTLLTSIKNSLRILMRTLPLSTISSNISVSICFKQAICAALAPFTRNRF